MLIKALWLVTFVCTLCIPAYPTAVQRNSGTIRRTGPIHPVLGVRGLGIDTIHPRIEIRELERNKDQFNVYLLGLRRLQSIGQYDKFSYYQIAGIHGRPYIPWDEVGKHPNGSNGYCAHGSNLFPTWHRPYLGLIEELLYSNAQQTISEFPVGEARDRMCNALVTFRMPYWDAAAIPPKDTSSFPSIVQQDMVEIEVPSGESTMTISVANPLYAYYFHPLPVDDSKSVPWILWNSTKRYPTSMAGSDVQYQYSAVIRAQHMGPWGVSKVFVFLDADMNINTGPASTQAWISESGFVGYAGFQNTIGVEETEMKTNGVVVLTVALEDGMRMGELRSMDAIVVGTYLQEKLHWLLVDANDNVIALERASGFSIGVSWAKMTPGTASTLPACSFG
ncbi:common central domain of tyrosinase-domain-containing protein [Alternaria rosae]|uniref:common central domain of tyrosinase-domain-containing protein n=1 Tax=Alternaria rosae TaxID=1187941 RepID=UPI001E8CC07F|nr:common central domain of tyrosinase-domain-containing protein [Alternaria rosae]KAH6864910.1 common central domain of tyrosinase-domain-containing protein [Alternaria rosae]